MMVTRIRPIRYRRPPSPCTPLVAAHYMGTNRSGVPRRLSARVFRTVFDVFLVGDFEEKRAIRLSTAASSGSDDNVERVRPPQPIGPRRIGGRSIGHQCYGVRRSVTGRPGHVLMADVG